MRKTLLCLLLVFFALGIPAYAAEMKEGAYVSFGRYGGEPILWRVTGSDAEGYFLLSDQILCFKPFDGQEGNWESSALRAWLNSAEDTVTYLHAPAMGSTQITANPYDTEKGFLSVENFTADELGMLTECGRRVVLKDGQSGSGATGTHYYIRDPRTAGDEAANMPAKTVSDLIFLPSPADIQHLTHSSEIFGVEYQIAAPTAQAAKSAASAGAKEGRGCCYWLNDMLWFSAEANHVYVMTPYNVISYARSYNGLVGVRPMCRLGKPQFVVSSGAGSKADPYLLSAEGISLQADRELVLTGDPIKVDLFSTLKGAVTYETYLNGVKCGGELIAVDGENEVYCRAFSGDGTLLAESNKVMVTGVSYQKEYEVFSNDFEGAELFQGFRYTTNPECAQGVAVDAEHGTSLAAISGNGKRFEGALPDFIGENVMAIEFDFMLPVVNSFQNNILTLKTDSNNWISPIAVKEGTFIVKDIASDFESVNIEAGHWYRVKLYCDQDDDTLTVVVSENGINHILCYKAVYTQPVEQILYGSFTSTWNSSATINTIYFDNMSVYSCAQRDGAVCAAASISGSRAEVSVYNPSGTAETVTVVGAVYQGDKMLASQTEQVILTPDARGQSITFQFEQQGEIRCFVLGKDLSPIPVKRAQ